MKFTAFVRSLDGEPTDEALDGVWVELRRILEREIRRRGLWESPPAYLQVSGHEAWTTPESAGARGAPSQTGDALDELTVDCYVELFAERRNTFRRYVERGDEIEGVVTLAIRQSLSRRQRSCDPLGFRLFQWLAAALQGAVDEGRLYVVKGGRGIDNANVLAFSPDADPGSFHEELPVPRLVDDDLLVTCMTASGGKETAALIARLRDLVLSFAGEGVEVFRFKDLADVLKHTVRARLAADWIGSEEPASPEDEAVDLVWEDPFGAVLERDWLHKLSDCVEAGIARRKAQKRTRQQLLKLWRFLVAFAGTAVDPAPPGDDPNSEALHEDEMPSRRALSGILGIHRDRISELLARLKSEVERCLDVLRQQPQNADTLEGSSRPEGTLAQTRDLRQELRRRTAEAYRHDAAEAPDEPRPGDVYALAAGRMPGLEWLVLEADGEALVLAAVDTMAWIGTSDLAAIDDDALGPLVVRCGHVLRLGAERLRDGRYSGSIAPFDLGRARVRRRQLLAGAVESTEEEQETDLDPDYHDWRRNLDEALENVRTVLPFEAKERKTRKGWSTRPLLPLAASLIAVVLSWRLYVVDTRITEIEEERQQVETERDRLAEELADERIRFEDEQEQARARHEQEVADLEERLAQADRPEVGVPWFFVGSGTTRSDPERKVLPPAARSVAFSILVKKDDQIEIRVRGGDRVWSTTVEDEPEDELWIRLPASLLPPEEYELLVWRPGRQSPRTRYLFSID